MLGYPEVCQGSSASDNNQHRSLIRKPILEQD